MKIDYVIFDPKQMKYALYDDTGKGFGSSGDVLGGGFGFTEDIFEAYSFDTLENAQRWICGHTFKGRILRHAIPEFKGCVVLRRCIMADTELAWGTL